MEKKPGKVIYIGSIPYDQTEQQILDIARSIGPVINLKMMFDKETGKSKGFAFVEYKDIETASSAVRNLNNYSIGNRQLKCDFSTENSLSNGNNSNSNANSNTNSRKRDNLPPLPVGISLSNNQTYQDSISQALQSLDSIRLSNIIKDSIQTAKSHPKTLKILLKQCPQLTYAIVEALLMTGKVNNSEIATILTEQKSEQIEINNSETIKQDEIQQDNQIEIEEEELDEEKIQLIKQVLAIPLEDLQDLSEDQKASILLIKENYSKGAYGNLV
ncbi:hypothetical protein WICMUC_005141 [Wickerhamomyces mucosus]|uniref:RRM domain-containing protein n=1 Tax=Wickerhamomyces mucosus TaxID=1378264 RepID=A0A9P8P8Y6_9ASCO|nr:hypothetical protein WICMUC_005141 [Wickerhamomyces mucosus]